MGRSRSLGIFALVALSLTSCGGPPEASDGARPSASQSPVSEKDVCRDWNEMVLTSSRSGLGGDHMRVQFRDQILRTAAKADGSLKAAMNVLAEPPQSDTTPQNRQRSDDAYATIDAACGTVEALDNAAPSSKPTLAPAPEPPVLGIVTEASVRNADGYTLDLIFRWSSDKGFVADPTNAKPGKTDSIITTDDFEFSVRNTTPSRAAKGSHLGFHPMALYPMSLGLCDDAEIEFGPTMIGNGQPNVITTPTGTYCLAQLGTSYGLLSVDIPPGAEESKSELMRGNSARVRGIGEMSPIVAQLNEPAFVGAVLTGDNWITDDGCPVTVSSPLARKETDHRLLVTGENLEVCG
jgi:hypothetical protein